MRHRMHEADRVRNMTDVVNEIKETDIVFDCPHFSKSLAIDYRGAGLSIPCSDCGRRVEVPIPEGLELADIDSSEEEQEIRILNLRRSLSVAQHRIEQLEEELADAVTRRHTLEGLRTKSIQKTDAVDQKAVIIREAVAKINEALDGIGKGLEEE